ncbi:MAG: hypothetical protein U0792_14820 [Gemmataceae bacterium]
MSRTRLSVSQLDDRIMPAGVDLTPAATYHVTNDWGSGYQAAIDLVNDQSSSLKDADSHSAWPRHRPDHRTRHGFEQIGHALRDWPGSV